MLKIGDYADTLPASMRPALDVPHQWYILISEPNKEAAAADGLNNRRLKSYAPTVYKRVSSGRQKSREVSRGMFPCYLFVSLPEDRAPWDRVRAVPGVHDFLSIHGGKARLEDAAIEAIRAREAQLEALRQERIKRATGSPRFEIGQSVTVPVGSYERLAGRISGISGQNVEVLMEMVLLGRNTVTVPLHRVTAVKVG